jgi:serine/threonine-protein kinase PpkA
MPTLAQRIGPELAPAAALEYLLQIAAALAALHASGRVHGGLGPAGILLRDDGRLSLGAGPGYGAVARGVNAVSARYMSPERVRLEPLDRRSDLYSLGAIAWEMLTGGAPLFEGRSALAVMCRHLAAPVPRLPLGLIRFQPVLDRMLAKDPAGRYQSALELIDDLKAKFADVLGPAPEARAA